MEITYIKKYIPKIKKEYPYLSDTDIENILKFGFERYAFAKKIHCDVMINDNIIYKLLAFTGYLTSNQSLYHNMSLSKKRKKRQFFYMIDKKKWDGTYYFGIDKKDVKKIEEFISNNETLSLPLKDVFFYMFYEDVEENTNKKLICQVKYPKYKFFRDYQKEYILDKNNIIKMEYINE